MTTAEKRLREGIAKELENTAYYNRKSCRLANASPYERLRWGHREEAFIDAARIARTCKIKLPVRRKGKKK